MPPWPAAESRAMIQSALLTDLYQLTMLAGYFQKGMHQTPAVFDLFFREAPFRGNFAVFAGLDTALEQLERLHFSEQDLAYLESLKLFPSRFLDFLSAFRFRGEIFAPGEGTVVFAHQPLLTVEASLAEAQLVETLLLNTINFQTLVATKAARIKLAAGEAEVVEFGLRRAQGPDGGLSVARAACIGGVTSTSNLLAGQAFSIPVKGTHAHSWVMAFADELSAFRAYTEVFPDHSVLLVDTYDTLRSGLPNAIIAARELRARGHELQGIRLDSGDLAFLSREARAQLDAAGFPQVHIVASNELDEHLIQSMRLEGARIDIYGVGTRLATCAGAGGGALGGVYKLVQLDHQPKLKLTSDLAKATLPGRKRLWRAVDPQGQLAMDVLTLEQEQPQPGDRVYDPTNPSRSIPIPAEVQLTDLRKQVMRGGQRTGPTPDLMQLAQFSQTQLQALPQGSLRLINPHRYKVSMSSGLHQLRQELIANLTP